MHEVEDRIEKILTEEGFASKDPIKNWGIKFSDKGREAQSDGGYTKYHEKKREERNLQSKINELQATNLRLHNREMRTRALFGIIGFVLGFLVNHYWKAMIEMMLLLFQ